ncbi:MAG: hypothetical protein ACLFSW_07150, partial [Halobacteriales archaeon]
MDEPNVGELKPPERVLLGPGPSNVHPRVLGAMNTSIVGHLDPYFVDIMDEVQDLLRYVFRTDNRWTLPVSGTGSASMEAAISNLVEPGDKVLVPTNGYFGARMESMAQRAGGETVQVDAPWGEPLDAVDVQEAYFDALDEAAAKLSHTAHRVRFDRSKMRFLDPLERTFRSSGTRSTADHELTHELDFANNPVTRQYWSTKPAFDG